MKCSECGSTEGPAFLVSRVSIPFYQHPTGRAVVVGPEMDEFCDMCGPRVRDMRNMMVLQNADVVIRGK